MMGLSRATSAWLCSTSRRSPPTSADSNHKEQTESAEHDTQIDAGRDDFAYLRRGWGEIDLDHVDLSPGVRSPRPTATAKTGPRSRSSASEIWLGSQSMASKGRASATGTPQDEARKSSMPASLAQPPDSTILPMRSDSAVDAK